MTASDANDPPAATPKGKCPICGKPTQHAVRPFCSSRCADIDLGRWVSGAYVIRGGQADADEDGDAGLAEGAQVVGDGTDPDVPR